MRRTSDGFGAGGAEVTQRPPLTIAWGEQQAGRSSRSRIAVLVILALMASMLVVGTAIARPVAALAAVCGPSNFWVNGTDGANVIREYQPDGTLVSEIPVASNYGDIAWTADGQELWAVSFATPAATLQRIDPSTGAVLATRPISIPAPTTESWMTNPVTNGTNSLSPYIHPTLGAGFLLGSYASTRIYFVPQSGPANAVVWSNWPTDNGLRIVSAGDFITLDDGTIAALGADRASQSTPSSRSYFVRIQPDGSSPTIVSTLPLAFGAAKSGGDLILALAAGGAVTKVAQSSIPTGASTALLPTTPVLTDPSALWNGATSKQDAGECNPDVPAYTVEKSSNPASGSTVQPGSSVTYTVTVRNTGNVAYTAGSPATFQDDLADVLDNATITAGPTASAGTAGISGSTLTWSGPLALGGTATVSYTVQINPNVAAGARLHNVVTPTGPSGTCVPGSCETDHPITPTPAPAFTVEKTSNPASGTAVQVGDVVDYTVTVRNTGNTDYTAGSPASFQDDLSDVLDNATLTAGPTASAGSASIAGTTLSWSGPLPVGGVVTVTYRVQVQGPITAEGQQLHNVVTPTAPTGSCVPGACATDHPITPTPAPAFTLAKSSNPASGSTVEVGDEVTYTVTVTNTGNADYTAAAPASFADDLTDVLDNATLTAGPTATAGTAAVNGTTLTWSGPLAVGGTATVTYTVQVQGPITAEGQQLHNVVTPTDPTGTCEPGECETDHPITPTPAPAFTVEKSSDPASGSTVEVGDEVTYTVTVRNTGNTAYPAIAPASFSDDLTDVLDNATLTAGPTASVGAASVTGNTLSWAGPLAVGGTATVTYTVQVQGPILDEGQQLHNVVTPTNPTGTCEPGECETDHPITPNPAPAFTVAKSSNPASGSTVEVGDEVTYSVTVTNTGNAPYTAGAPASFADDLTDVLDNATLTAGPTATAGTAAVNGTTLTWSGPLAVGGTATVTYTVQVQGPITAEGQQLHNVVTPTDPTGTCEPGECETDHPITPNPAPAFTVAKSSNPSSGSTVAVGDEVTYTVTVSNTGNSAYTAAAPASFADDLTDVLDNATLIAGPTASAGAASVAGTTLSWEGPLAVGGTATVTYTVQVQGPITADGEQLHNVVTPTEPTGTCEPGECETDHPITPTPAPAFTVQKSSDPASGSTVEVGDEVTYTVTVTNTGNTPYTAATPASFADDLTDVLDNATLMAGPTATAGTATVNGTTLTWSGPLAVGGTATVTYTVQVQGPVLDEGQQLHNVVTPTDPTGTCEPGECETDHPITPNPAPAFTVAKSSDPAPGSTVAAGDEVTYTVTVANTGNAPYPAIAPASFSDDLSDVLDNATLTAGPTASAGTASVTGNTLTWAGPLAVGGTATVTYTVRVDGPITGDAEQLHNVVTPTNPTGECVPGECETDHPLTPDPVPVLDSWKTVTADSTPVAAGTVLTYTLFFENTGDAAGTIDEIDDLTGVTDDADVTTEPTSPDGLTVSRAGNIISITGGIPAGATYSVTYQVTVKADADRGDDIAANFLLAPGEEPPATCQPTDAQRPDCTVTPIGRLLTTKAVSASTNPVAAGTVLTYTLTFDNQGEGPATVNHTDHLSGVLDDADLTSAPTSSNPALTASAVSGGQFTVTGDLPAGQTATVTYQVTVKADADRGDNVAENFLVPTDEEPPTDCVPEDPNCTETPIPAIVVTKSSDPASGTTVVAGQEVTYTLTFANTGEAAGAVDYTDHLNGVLDDADLVSGPTSSDAALAADQETTDEGEFVHIYGTLEPGDSVTVSYTVRVKADGQRGDNLLGNVLAETTNTEPECEEPDVHCTENPVPLLNVTKSSNPVSGSTVVTGQDVTYTLTFANSGQGVGTIDYTDRLADVLDDATLVSGPTASDAALTAATGADQTLHITGALAGGQTVTVSYTVRVNAEDARGNNILGNVLAKTTNTEPECGEDGVSCTEHPIPLLESWKAVEADSTPVAAGTVLTYTLFFENSGEAPATVNEIDDLTGVTDDADVTTEPTSTDGLTVSRAGNIISITGEVPAGETYSVTYRVTVKADADRGDDIAANFLLAPGEEPPATCQPTDAQRPDCTVTPIGRLLTSKAVSADSDPVEAGTKLTYTLTFDNQGEGPVTVDHTDVLTDVLDDADVTTNPVASDAALVASAVTGGQFTVTGELAAGQTVTVSYTVTVKADADRGNNSADNFLVPTDEEPPTECVPEDPNCTVTPLPLVGVVKTADPASGSDVQAGQAVTYTLTFSNTGNAAGTVDYTDDLANVLDDADLTVAPVSSDPALTPTSGADGLVRITGTLQQGQTVTVSYTVTMKPDGQRGDNWLRNVVAHTGTENPDCEDTGVSCTEHPIGELDDWKTVDPASGSTLRPGETATYTLHFENTGNAHVAVNRDDVLDRVLDDADVTTQPVSSDAALSASPIAGGRFTVTGELQPGQHVTVSYTVTVKVDGQRGDDRLVNFLIPAGETPPEECIPTDGTRAIANRPDCTITHVSDVTVAKSSDPASGSKVGPGQDVTYTLTFTNRGVNPDAADVAVDYTDHMAGVLDDATLTGAPVASDPALTASVAGDTIRITGEIPTGEVVTVTYTVKVKAWAQQGDHRLANVVAVTGSQPVCVPDSPLCTEHTVPPPVPGLAITGGALPIGIASTALLLLITGGILLAIRRRRQNDAASLGDEEDALV